MQRAFSFAAVLFFASYPCCRADFEQSPVFTAGEGGYHTYRIPSLIVTAKGTLLAFCEGRKKGTSDAGDIDLVLRRSLDGGKTWQAMQVVWDDRTNTCGNPCPVVERSTGTIWLHLTHNLGEDKEAAIIAGKSKGTRTAWVTKSTDDGVTWARPTEITKSVKQPDWTWYASGPGVGIQTKAGRLVIPCDNKVAVTMARQSHVIYSDDKGETWKLGGVVGPNCNESQVAELTDGSLLLNMRSYEANHRRMIATSSDGGLTWSQPVEDQTLIEPVCQASLMRYPGDKPLLLFSNPASTKREKMTVRLSRDDGKSWPAARQLHAGPAAYSCLSVLNDGTIACLYERGKDKPYDNITLARFSLPWLEQGRPTIDVGTRTQLFLDDYAIAEQRGLKRDLGQVTKANGGKPIFTDGWFYGTVLHDEGKFKLWFRKEGTQGYGYAESEDGLQFTKKADLTGINFAGDYTLAVERDGHAMDAPRFIAGYDALGMAAGIATSSDGIQWTPLNSGQPVTGRAADTYNQVLWDAEAKTYRLFTRTDFGPAGGSTELRGTRSMTNPNILADPKDWKPVRAWKFDKEGPGEAQRRQIYAATCWIHHGVYFALLSVYEYVSDLSEGKTTDLVKRHERDILNCYLATSRDGKAWDLRWVYADKPLIPRGGDGTFDKDLLLPASTIVTHGDKHWLYYAGANERHGNEQVHFGRKHSIGLATLPLDRFVALSAEKESGTVTTRPFKLEGKSLLVNVDAGQGSAAIEVLDESGSPLASYSGAEATVLSKSDQLRWQPAWKRDLGALQGRNIRLRFRLQNAKLYSFQVVKDS